MIDEYSDDGTGWARLSEPADAAREPLFRYRLGRILTPALLDPGWVGMRTDACRVVFVMLNPSTADAFALDPTVRRCAKFATRWGADVVEVVNLFAFRSPHPRDLVDRVKNKEPIGDDELNDRQILNACAVASRVIAAWGENGSLFGRGAAVTEMLRRAGVALECLGRVPSCGAPMHPLARGKHWIPDDREPTPW